MLVVADAFSQDTWRRVYGADNDERASTVRVISPDEIIAVGSTGSFGFGNSDIYLMKTDGAGNQLWSKTIGGPEIEQASDLRVLSDGGFAIVGSTNDGDYEGYDALLIRTDDEGNLLWQKTFGGHDWDFFNEIKILEGGDFLITGQTYSTEEIGGNAWLMRVDNSGDIIWEKTIGGSGWHDGLSAAEVPGDGYVMVGSFLSETSGTDGLVARFDNDGEILWIDNYGGDSLDIARDVVVCQDGGFSIVGTTESYSEHTEAWHLRLSAEGEELWFKNWGQIDDQESLEHVERDDGTFITAGYTKTTGGGGKDMFLLKSDTDGAFIYGRTFGGFQDDEAMSIDVMDTGFIIGGYSKSYGSGSMDVFLVKTDFDGFTENEDVISFFDPLSAEQENAGPDLIVFPNPTNGIVQLKSDFNMKSVAVMNLLGEELEEFVPNSSNAYIPLSLPSGTYILQVTFRDGDVLNRSIQVVNH